MSENDMRHSDSGIIPNAICAMVICATGLRSMGLRSKTANLEKPSVRIEQAQCFRTSNAPIQKCIRAVSNPMPQPTMKSKLLMRLFALLVMALLDSAVFSVSASAAIFAGVDDGTRSRFLGGAAPVLNSPIAVNPDFPINETLISGIALDSNGSLHQSAVLITPRHYVAAAHNATTAPWFRGSDGIVREYPTVSSTLLTTEYELDGMTLVGNSDIRVWTLDDSVPLPGSHGVTPLPILTGTPAAFFGREIYASDQFNSFGRNIIDELALSTFSSTDDIPNQPTFSIVYDFDSLASGNAVGPDEIFLRSGDSGNAAIAIIDGNVALVGNHFGIDPDARPQLSVSTLLAPYVDQINAHTSQQPGGYTVSTIVLVPEPSSGLAMAIATTTIVLARRRRRI